MEIEIPFYSHPKTYKDPIGTALHTRSKHGRHNTDKDTLRTRCSRLHDYRETSEEREVSRDIGFIPDVEDHVTFLTATAGSDVVQSGRPIFDDFFQHLWPHIGNNTANVVLQMVKRLCLIRIDQ
ncbi:hypothetical protein TNCV_1438631 [Trichonephila clavipes]|nr:hypothetical protein TNCV_1438631 [Trichonephila clavipes]